MTETEPYRCDLRKDLRKAKILITSNFEEKTFFKTLLLHIINNFIEFQVVKKIGLTK